MYSCVCPFPRRSSRVLDLFVQMISLTWRLLVAPPIREGREGGCAPSIDVCHAQLADFDDGLQRFRSSERRRAAVVGHLRKVPTAGSI